MVLQRQPANAHRFPKGINTVKKIILAVAAVAFAVSLSACAGEVNVGDTPDSGSSTTKQLSNGGTVECIVVRIYDAVSVDCIDATYVPPAK